MNKINPAREDESARESHKQGSALFDGRSALTTLCRWDPDLQFRPLLPNRKNRLCFERAGSVRVEAEVEQSQKSKAVEP